MTPRLNFLFVLITVMSILVTSYSHGQTALIQHLDASIEESLVTDGNGAVTSWLDQTTNQNNAIPITGNVNKAKDGDISWIDLGTERNVLELFSSEASDALLNQSENSNGFCVALVIKINGFRSDWNDLIGNSSAVGSGFGIRYNSTGSIKAYLGGKTISGSSVAQGQVLIFAFNYNAEEGKFDLWDSNSKSTASGNMAKADFSNAQGLTLGSTENSSRFFHGYVGEVQLFNKNLSEEDFQNLQNSLFLKWVATDAEKDPPSPNPASFSIVPTGVSGSIISMTANLGTDENGPVEYQFTETTGNPGGSSSEWQHNPNYRDGDLHALTAYSYTVTMRDAFGNTGTPSEPKSATTTEYVQPGQENELEYGAYYGYQGWHFAKGDGRVNANDWVHWFEGQTPNAESIHGDMWPDLREYDQNNLYETQMKYLNGETAKLYSCFDYSTIDLHIKWMSEYGIKGCAVQRFTSSIDKPNKLEQGDKKIRDVMTACEKYGVKFWIMHDSGQGDENEYNRITNDWKHLVDDLDVLQSPAYTWQNGLPVYGFWGVGVSSRQWTPEQANALLDFYQNGDEKYRTYVCAGVPVNWRTSPPAGWKPVFDRLDMISPWRTIFGKPDQDKARMQDDLAYCTSKGIDYNPVVSPGASTQHLRDGDHMRNWKPRNGGHFLWKQAYEVCKMGSKFMYVAMFDEVDEGTAMYKLVETVENLPVGATQVPLNEDGYNLPSDWYLQIGTEIQKMIEGKTPVTPTIPIDPEATSAKNFKEKEPFNTYPVPANNRLYLSSGFYRGTFKIMDSQGHVLLENVFEKNVIDISSLKPGLYLLEHKGNVTRFVKINSHK